MDKRSRVMGMWLAILIGQCAVVAPVLAQGEQSEADKVFASRTQPIELYASGLGTFEKPISTSNGNGVGNGVRFSYHENRTKKGIRDNSLGSHYAPPDGPTR